MMTKNQFIALADVIRLHNELTATHKFTESHIECLADFCKSQNPNFNRERWVDYIQGKCGPNGGPIKEKKSV